MESNVFVGVKFGSAGNGISNDLKSGTEPSTSTSLPNTYDYILLPITNPRYREAVRQQFQNFKQQHQQQQELIGEVILKISEPQLQDLCIAPFNVHMKDDAPAYIGLLSSWLELESHDILVREMCYQVLLNECKYARFVGINKLILPPPRELSDLQRYSQVIARLLNNETISTNPPLLLSISLPLYEDSDPLATWELWNTVRKLCDYHPSLSISLAVPRKRTPSHVLNRWLCEPVSCLLISSSIFATNQYNYPVLHKFNQNLISKFQNVNGNSQPNPNSELCIILHGMEKYASRIKGGEPAYLEYINYLLKKGDKLFMSKDNEITIKNSNNKTARNDSFNSNKMQSGFNQSQDVDFQSPRLMPPLKPHSESLTNYVYSVFEKDTVKYDLYQTAIQKSLLDLLVNSTSQKLVILIAGAGRGPLVDRTVQVLKHLNALNQVQLIALEKNRQACLYLQKRNFDCWNNRVKIIKKDMCEWKDESIKIDLCISELLGSFGCNELSPECLWFIEKYHAKPSTIFIPESYTSYVAPIASPLLHQKLVNSDKAQESPWIMHNIPYCILSSKINEVWSFEHPVDKNKHKADVFFKNAVSEFKIKHRGEIHGLMGFFTAKLYGDTVLSTLPNDSIVKQLYRSPQYDEGSDSQNISSSQEASNSNLLNITSNTAKKDSNEKLKKWNHTPNMHSWSPLVFPLRQPFPITDDTEFSVFLSRNFSSENNLTWYEWSAESFMYLVVSGAPMIKQQGVTTLPPAVSSANKPPIYPLGSEGDDAAFSNSIPDNAFLPHQESGWQSVNDVHGVVNGVEHAETPMFNLAHRHKGIGEEQEEEEEEEDDEVHVRVKTGVTALHNVNGKSFSIPL